MKHVYVQHLNGNIAYTSNNLMFSARWFEQYIKTFRLPVVQTTKHSIFGSVYQGDLAEQMNYEYKKDDKISIKDLLKKKRKHLQDLKGLENKLASIGEDHYFNMLKTV